MNEILNIELTTTDGCNCNCSYCFEVCHKHINNDRVENRQLELIMDLSRNLDKTKYSGINISFWGGEPFLNYMFMDKIFRETSKYSFITYHIYTNGTLIDNIKNIFESSYFNDIYDRVHIQFSYDGEPHHTLKRGYNTDILFKTVEYIFNKGICFDFKATLSLDSLDMIPSIWDSYLELYNKYNWIYYSPTLDTTNKFIENSENFSTWKKSINEIAKKEYKFFLEHGRFLSSFFNRGKLVCNLSDSIFLHSDGNMYNCHGCPYLSSKNNYIIGNIFDIDNLYSIINFKYDLERPDICKKCVANYCAICHVNELKKDSNVYTDWSTCLPNNINKCKYYKYLGYIYKLLLLNLIDNS